jgi:hypothetical protein
MCAYRAVPEAVAASLVGATLDSPDSRNYQQGPHRAAVGMASVAVAVTDNHDQECWLGIRSRRHKTRMGCTTARQQRTVWPAVADIAQN